MSKVLFRETIGNGYGCSCCAQEFKSCEWIDESMMLALIKY